MSGQTPDYEGDDESQSASPAGSPEGRPYVGIFFECCRVYSRVYRRKDQSQYSGRCPRCLRPVRIRIGKDGTDARLFRAW